MMITPTPLPPEQTDAKGIHQSDIILRGALVAAIADLRANPNLLDYVFASLPQDDLTAKLYGQKSVQRAKDWFLRTNLPIAMLPRMDEAKLPYITIKLVSSDESEVTLGDIHYQSTEDNNIEWPALAGPFEPLKYNPITGIMVLPDVQIILAPGMVLVDTHGTAHTILDIFDDGSISIGLNVVADFSKTLLKGARPVIQTQLESVSYRENYQIGCHVSSEPVYLTWLHSVIVFCLLRYKQTLLEARGFERSTFSSSDFTRYDINEGENVFVRYINITGTVRQYWPKFFNPKITAFLPELVVSSNLDEPTNPDALWNTIKDS